MPHIHTGPGEYDSTVSAFILREEPRPQVLLHRHKLLGIWLQPGGHIELTEHPWQAVAHELLEETGYGLAQLEVLQSGPAITGLVETTHPTPLLYRSHSFPNGDAPHFHTDASFAFVAAGEPASALAEGESPTLEWLDEEALLALPADEIIPDTRTIALALLRTMGAYRRHPAAAYEV